MLATTVPPAATALDESSSAVAVAARSPADRDGGMPLVPVPDGGEADAAAAVAEEGAACGRWRSRIEGTSTGPAGMRSYPPAAVVVDTLATSLMPSSSQALSPELLAAPPAAVTDDAAEVAASTLAGRRPVYRDAVRDADSVAGVSGVAVPGACTPPPPRAPCAAARPERNKLDIGCHSRGTGGPTAGLIVWMPSLTMARASLASPGHRMQGALLRRRCTAYLWRRSVTTSPDRGDAPQALAGPAADPADVDAATRPADPSVRAAASRAADSLGGAAAAAAAATETAAALVDDVGVVGTTGCGPA